MGKLRNTFKEHRRANELHRQELTERLDRLKAQIEHLNDGVDGLPAKVMAALDELQTRRR